MHLGREECTCHYTEECLIIRRRHLLSVTRRFFFQTSSLQF